MHIALDATPLTIPSGGLRRYTEEMTRALAQRFPADQFRRSPIGPSISPQANAWANLTPVFGNCSPDK